MPHEKVDHCRYRGNPHLVHVNVCSLKETRCINSNLKKNCLQKKKHVLTSRVEGAKAETTESNNCLASDSLKSNLIRSI